MINKKENIEKRLSIGSFNSANVTGGLFSDSDRRKQTTMFKHAILQFNLTINKADGSDEKRLTMYPLNVTGG